MSANSESWDDWVTIWQSELAAMAADRELQETMQRGIDLWAARSLAPAPEPEHAAGLASPAPAEGPTPAAAASVRRPAEAG